MRFEFPALPRARRILPALAAGLTPLVAAVAAVAQEAAAAPPAIDTGDTACEADHVDLDVRAGRSLARRAAGIRSLSWFQIASRWRTGCPCRR